MIPKAIHLSSLIVIALLALSGCSEDNSPSGSESEPARATEEPEFLPEPPESTIVGNTEPDKSPPPRQSSPAGPPQKVVANLKPEPGHRENGIVTIDQAESEGLRIQAELNGLEPGQAYSLFLLAPEHRTKKDQLPPEDLTTESEPPFLPALPTEAGAFPAEEKNADPDMPRKLGNVMAGQSGRARLTTEAKNLTFGGEHSIFDLEIVLQKKAEAADTLTKDASVATTTIPSGLPSGMTPSEDDDSN